jgi:hypothetical protein
MRRAGRLRRRTGRERADPLRGRRRAALEPGAASERRAARDDTLAELAGQLAPLADRAPATRVLTGAVGPQLRRLASLERAALVVVGPSRRGPIREALARSPRWHLLRRRAVPVMVCPSVEAALGPAGHGEARAQARPA